MSGSDYEYRQLTRSGRCCACGRKIYANKDYVIHGYNYKSNAGTLTLCTLCVTYMNKLVKNFHQDKEMIVN